MIDRKQPCRPARLFQNEFSLKLKVKTEIANRVVVGNILNQAL